MRTIYVLQPVDLRLERLSTRIEDCNAEHAVIPNPEKWEVVPYVLHEDDDS